jgi:hypothetical protein
MLFYLGLTDRRRFFWIIQLMDMTKPETLVLECKLPAALNVFTTQKIAQLQSLIPSEFMARLQAHLTKTDRGLEKFLDG